MELVFPRSELIIGCLSDVSVGGDRCFESADFVIEESEWTGSNGPNRFLHERMSLFAPIGSQRDLGADDQDIGITWCHLESLSNQLFGSINMIVIEFNRSRKGVDATIVGLKRHGPITRLSGFSNPANTTKCSCFEQWDGRIAGKLATRTSRDFNRPFRKARIEQEFTERERCQQELRVVFPEVLERVDCNLSIAANGLSNGLKISEFR